LAVAAIYARKSKVTEKGDSIDNQIKICKQYSENLNIDDYLIYKDEGFSGKNIDRPEFIKMMRDAQQKKFSVLICYKLDRISRSVSDFSNLVNDLERLGISFISVNEQFDTSTAMGRAMMLICSVFAQLERETISQRVRDNMYSMAENGNWLGGKAPAGFESKRIIYTDDNGKEKTYSVLTTVDEEQDLIKLIFSKYLELGSLSKLEKYMLSNNIKSKYENDFSKTSLKAILSSPVYVRANIDVINYYKKLGVTVHGDVDGVHGILTYNKRMGKNGKLRDYQNWVYAVSSHEGIIDPDIWLKTQKLLNINRTKAPAQATNRIALLSEHIRCAKCNSYMRVAYGKQYADKDQKKFYYVCSLKTNSGKTRCDNKNVNGYDLDGLIIDKLKELSVDKSVLISELQKYKSSIENSNENSEIKNLTSSIKQNNSMLDNLLKNLSATTDEEIVNMIFNRINNIKEENKQFQKRLDELKLETEAQDYIINNCDTFIKYLKNFSLAIDTCTFEEKRRLISSLIDKVYVDGGTGRVQIRFLGVDKL
jgi:site-specific DNA recombinase